MNGILVRVGIDSSYGRWNAPMDPDSGDYFYLPIPENLKHEILKGLEKPYKTAIPWLYDFTSRYLIDLYGGLGFPRELEAQNMHLDPDFERLTYGDRGDKRGKGVASLDPGDFLAFYASLKPIRPYRQKLIYALIGFYKIEKLVWAGEVDEIHRDDNAHLRRKVVYDDDVIVYANPEYSGRFRQCIPIGEYRDKSYRVTKTLLREWGDLTIKDGFIQRSINPPFFKDPEKFIQWLDKQEPELLHTNFKKTYS